MHGDMKKHVKAHIWQEKTLHFCHIQRSKQDGVSNKTRKGELHTNNKTLGYIYYYYVIACVRYTWSLNRPIGGRQEKKEKGLY